MLIFSVTNILRTGSVVSTEAHEYSQITETANWVDSVYLSMTVDERIGQLLMIRAHSNLGSDHVNQVKNLIDKYHVGALCFFQGTPEKQVELTNEYQARTKIPLLIAMDAEWGLGMRLKESAMSFPRQLALGAIEDDFLIYRMGREIGRQLRRIGVHLNFAPVVDVNNNSNNPVINTRSFGEHPYPVAEKGIMYMLGMQQSGVMACAKHFPGHGDTDVDSHYDLPVIEHSYNRLDSIELTPFKRLIDRGVNSIMVAHLQVPALDSSEHTPTTLSYPVVTGELKQRLGFDGLIITDGMEMEGVTKHYPSGEAEAIAIAAGNDMICLPRNVPKTISAIKNYVESGKIPPERIEESVKKVLTIKYNHGLHRKQYVDPAGIEEDLHRVSAQALNRQLIEGSLTLARNHKVLPLKTVSSNTAIVDVGSGSMSSFQKRMMDFGFTSFYRKPKGGLASELKDELANKDRVVITMHDMSNSPSSDYGISEEDSRWIEGLARETDVVVVLFGNPYAAQYFDDVKTLVVAYDDSEIVQDLTAQALCGASVFSGKLPVTASSISKSGQGVTTSSLFRLGFALPEEVGMSSGRLLAVDTIMQEIIEKEVAPGGQVLAIKDGRIVLRKSYGHHTYAGVNKVDNLDMYDVASLTKILATTISTMKLFDEGKVSVFHTIEEYLPELKGTNKAGIVIEDILIHSARLEPWIPFYRNTLDDTGKPDGDWYSDENEAPYTIEVAEDLFINQTYKDTIWQQIIDSELLRRSEYKYSDLGFYIMDRIINRVSGQPLDEYATENFYDPLGLQRTMFNPLKRVSAEDVVPTEKDEYFRYQELQGHVHDMGAAMCGGVCGHAGLFSNAYEVGIIMQMLMNGGYYGGKRYLHPVTVSLFTARPENETRRGLGFDMKQLDPGKHLNMAKEASYKTFGHLGFTGTCVWADPMNNLIIVFLSNRTYPDMSRKNMLSTDNYRPRLQSAIYNAVLSDEDVSP